MSALSPDPAMRPTATALAADLYRVSKASRCQKSGAVSFALDECVRDQRRAVYDDIR